MNHSIFESEQVHTIKKVKRLKGESLTIILLEPKVFSLGHQYKAKPGSKPLPNKLQVLDIPKIDNRQFQNWNADSSI